MLNIQTIVSDLDETLLTAGHTVSDRTVRVLGAVQARGIRVILASGRSPASARPHVLRVGTAMPFIASNGAQILSPSGEKLFEATMPTEVARELVTWLHARGIYVQAYDDEAFYYDNVCEHSIAYAQSSGIPGILVESLSARIQAPQHKMLAIASPDVIEPLRAEAVRLFGDRVSLSTSQPEFLEITPLGTSKGAALEWLAPRYGIDPATTLAAGDSLNDLSMLAWAGMPVAVENARPEVKRVAWRMAGHGQHDGLANLLEELLGHV